VEPLRGSGDGDRERADERARVDAHAGLREVAIGARGADVRDPEREAAAAEVPRLRVDDGQRERGRDRGVRRVAALVEDLEADLRGERVLRDDGALLRRAPVRLLLELRAPAAGEREETRAVEERERGLSDLRRR
jgi:hypothetical protein